MLLVADSLFWRSKSRGVQTAFMEKKTVPSLTIVNFGVGDVTAVLIKSTHLWQQKHMGNPSPNTAIQNRTSIQTHLSYLAQTTVLPAPLNSVPQFSLHKSL